MSMAVDFGGGDWDECPDADYWYEESELTEDVLIATVTHLCCGKVQSYFNCGEEDVPGPEAICRDCQPVTVESEFDPFADEERRDDGLDGRNRARGPSPDAALGDRG